MGSVQDYVHLGCRLSQGQGDEWEMGAAWEPVVLGSPKYALAARIPAQPLLCLLVDTHFSVPLTYPPGPCGGCCPSLQPPSQGALPSWALTQGQEGSEQRQPRVPIATGTQQHSSAQEPGQGQEAHYGDTAEGARVHG